MTRLPIRLGAVLTIFGASCVYPTERSDELRVVLDTIPDLLQGEGRRLSGVVVDAEDRPIPNIELAFTSSNSLVANVFGDTMIATGIGVAEITATAVGFAQAAPSVQLIRIHDLIEIDSIRPLNVRFGDSLTIFGTGLNPEPFPGTEFILVSLGGDAVGIPKSYVPSNPDFPNRFGRLTVWVPPPAPPLTQVFVLGVEGLAVDLNDTLRVLQRDLYEPNDTIPWDFGVPDGPIFNPALAFERRQREENVEGADWYRFSLPQPSDVTVLLSSNDVSPETYDVFFTDSLEWDGTAFDFAIGPTAWTVGPSLFACAGFPIVAPQAPDGSRIIALRNLPAGSYDLIAGFRSSGAYQMAILPGYESVLPPDNAEENDYCDAAAPLVLGQNRFLTIDNPHEADWFQFTVTDPSMRGVFDVRALDPEGDLDVYVFGDFRPDSITFVGESQVGGADDVLTEPLPPGDYLLLVIDFAGVATNYTLTSSLVADIGPTPASMTVGERPAKQASAPGILRSLWNR